MINSFINNGYFKFNKLNIKKNVKKLNSNILKEKKIDKDIFLTKKKYYLIKNKKFETKDILTKFKIDFLLNNNQFNKTLSRILGKNFTLYAQRVICSVPKSIYPLWIKKKLEGEVPNLNKFIKPKYRYMRYLAGADFHSDYIDFPTSDKGNFITIYVYLDKVTKSRSPLILLPKTHLAGYDKYPHNLKHSKTKNKIIYYPKNKKKISTNKIYLIGKAGDAWGWHAHLLHGTNQAYSKVPRLSLRLIFKNEKPSKLSKIFIVNKKIRNYSNLYK